MPRKSSVKRLPPDILEEVNKLLSGGQTTLDEILVHLKELGAPNVSRSALGRHKQQIDKVIERLRQSREMTDAIAQRLGPDAVEGTHGRALVQMLTAMTGEYMIRRMDDPDADTEAKELMALARTVKDASQAARSSQDFELKIREQAEKEACKKAEDRLNGAARLVESEIIQSGLTPSQVLERMQAVYRGEI